MNTLVQEWERRQLAPSTRKIYMSQLCWWAEKVDKSSIINSSNRSLGIPHRHRSPVNKGQELSASDFSKFKNPYVRFGVMLQHAFGLRKEEAIKFRPSYPNQDHHIRLKGSWTKGGRPRKIPISQYSQRELLDEVRKFAGSGSLIPTDKMYVQQVYIRKRRIETRTKEAARTPA